MKETTKNKDSNDASSKGGIQSNMYSGIEASSIYAKKLKQNQYDQAQPWLVNNSSHTIFYKPEGGESNGAAIPVLPGEVVMEPIDGVAAPHIRRGEVFKSIDGVSVVVTNDRLDWSYTSTGSLKIIADYLLNRGGWKGKAWHDDLRAGVIPTYAGDPPVLFKDPDNSWDSLFEASQN